MSGTQPAGHLMGAQPAGHFLTRLGFVRRRGARFFCFSFCLVAFNFLNIFFFCFFIFFFIFFLSFFTTFRCFFSSFLTRSVTFFSALCRFFAAFFAFLPDLDFNDFGVRVLSSLLLAARRRASLPFNRCPLLLQPNPMHLWHLPDLQRTQDLSFLEPGFL